MAANGLFVLAAAAAVAYLVAPSEPDLEPYVFVAAGSVPGGPVLDRAPHRHRRAVDQETMLGALATYLFIGMAFAFVYRFLGAAQASAFFGDRGDGTLSQDLFFSFVTLTTTGYEDLVPAGNPGRAWPCSRPFWASCSSSGRRQGRERLAAQAGGTRPWTPRRIPDGPPTPILRRRVWVSLAETT